MSRFRPCIDLHQGVVKQIVGGTLTEDGRDLHTNFVSDRGPAYYAQRYRRDGLCGGHVIMLGPGNEAAAEEALAAWPDGLQVGGGVRPGQARRWIDAGASHVIVTSALFEPDGRFLPEALQALVDEVGVERLVIDLSCRTAGSGWVVAMDRWQTRTDLPVTEATLDRLAPSCAEFLVHAADVEGRCRGIDEDLVRLLGQCAGRPVTYAGGARALEDLDRVAQLSDGRVDLAVGSALDLFGGQLIRYDDCVNWNRTHAAP